MKVTHYFTASLTAPTPAVLYAVKGDGARMAVARLMAGAEAWTVPEGVTAGISYTLPDKTPGYYDRLEDGAPACMIAGNLVSAVIAPVLTGQAGAVKASIVLRDADGDQVATFPFQLRVEQAPGIVDAESVPAMGNGFEGKLFYGGPGGALTALALGDGVRVETTEDGTLALVAEGGSGGGGGITEEKDPTVPAWAKQPQKPTYTAQEVGALPAGTKIPGKTSELTNDAGFVDKAVSDLTNYYTKAQTQELIAAIPRFRVTVVQQLPAAGEELTLYLVPFATAEGQYLEYIWVDGRWEIIGSQRVDLTGYATEEWVQEYVEEHSGQNLSLDTTLTQSGKAADAKAVGDALDELEEKIPSIEGLAKTEDIPTKPEDIGAQPKGNYASLDDIPKVPSWAMQASKPGYTKSEVGLGNVDNVRQYSASNQPPYPVTSVNGQTGAVTVPVPNIDGLAQIEYVDSAIASEAANRKKAIADLEVKMNQQSLNFAEGDTMEEALAWLKANGDPSKYYIMPDNFFYRCVEKTTAGGTVPNFTNVLDTATISLNDRYSLSTHALKGAGTAAGFIAIDHIPVTKGQIIRVNKADALDGKYSRIIFYDSAASPLSANDVEAYKYAKLTKSGDVVSFVAGYYNTTSGNDSTNTSVSGAPASVRLNLYISGSSITAEDIADLIVTVDEPIEYTTAPGGTELVWESTGRSFISTEYDDQIADLRKDVDELKAATGGADTNMVVYAPSPQLPADGSDKADFNAETITCKDIYDYIDALAAKYPKFITKEILGKDQSGEFDWNRYTCCRRYYEAWQKQNYPKMYGWTNGSTTIYSVSVSPRIGDTLYATAYIGTAKGTVSAVSNADQTRTVAGVVYTRDKTKDVEPTLIYSVMLSSKAGNSVYNSSKVKVTTISSITSTTIVGADGNTYHRYPLGDRNANFVKPKVIVIGSNEHGRPLDPAEPAIISSRMIKDLCECTNANNPFLNTLKNEYMVVFLPIINPWGYDNSHKSYYNSRGVNLDRNLDTPGWGNDTSNPQGEYGGSEAEMQYFMNTLVESGAKIVSANHALGTQTNSTGEGANSGRCHYMLGRNNSKYDQDLLVIAETMLANYNLFFTDYGEAPPESYAKTRSYIDWIGAEGGAVEMQAREGYVLDGTSQLHTARILEADYTLLLQFLHMLIKHS